MRRRGAWTTEAARRKAQGMFDTWLQKRGPKVAVLRLQGAIATRDFVSGASLAFSTVVDSIDRAFRMRGAKAVALMINSPGGSPVQARRIHDRIRQMADEKKRPVYAFCEDVAASGGYMLACAGDHVFADESSIIGSIGVISAGFGFPDLIAKIGVERRVYTSGKNKLILDPFQSEDSEHVSRLEAIQAAVHESFKALVRARRGGRLNAPEDTLFDGRFWAGGEAARLGLIDGIGDPRKVLQERFGRDVRLVAVPQRKRGLLARAVGAHAGEFPAALAGMEAALESRLLWARYGL